MRISFGMVIQDEKSAYTEIITDKSILSCRWVINIMRICTLWVNIYAHPQYYGKTLIWYSIVENKWLYGHSRKYILLNCKTDFYNVILYLLYMQQEKRYYWYIIQIKTLYWLKSPMPKSHYLHLFFSCIHSHFLTSGK